MVTKLDADQVIKNVYDEAANKLRVDSTFSGTISVALDAATDSVAIGDGTDELVINPDGSINAIITDISLSQANDSVAIGDGTDLITSTAVGVKQALDMSNAALFSAPANSDYFSVATPDTVTEIYSFKSGGSGGTLLRTITIVYTDATKAVILSGTVV